MDKVISIVEGYGNLALKAVGIENEEVEMLAGLRAKICNDCERDGNPVMHEGRCTLCNCVMQAKWRSITAKCPLKKW